MNRLSFRTVYMNFARLAASAAQWHNRTMNTEIGVPAIRLHPHEGDFLAFDLKEILSALGARGVALHWTIGDVASRGVAFDATGEGAAALEELVKSGERVTGSRLAQIAETVQQVIWGEFKGYEGNQAVMPYVIVVAFDSSWWEIQTASALLLDRVAKAFSRVERL